MTALAVVPQPGDPHARPGNHPKENTVTERRWQDIATNPTPPAVKTGQVWRRNRRHVRVESTDGAFATVVRCGIDGKVYGVARRSRIRIVGDRLLRYRRVYGVEATRD